MAVSLKALLLLSVCSIQCIISSVIPSIHMFNHYKKTKKPQSFLSLTSPLLKLVEYTSKINLGNPTNKTFSRCE